MRSITDHITNPANDRLAVEACSALTVGGAPATYVVTNGSVVMNRIEFQDGPINEVGVNGLTHEVLLAVVIDRLRQFQLGPYACEENELARVHTEMALRYLQERTKARVARGVEGTHVV